MAPRRTIPRLQIQLSGLSNDSGAESDYDKKLSQATAAEERVQMKKQNRKEARDKAHRVFRASLANLKDRIEKSSSDKRAKTMAVRKERLSRLVNALDTQQTLETSITEKLSDLQGHSVNLVRQLFFVFKGRMEEGQKAGSVEVSRMTQTLVHE